MKIGFSRAILEIPFHGGYLPGFEIHRQFSLRSQNVLGLSLSDRDSMYTGKFLPKSTLPYMMVLSKFLVIFA
ncbi:MAG: hypothetical protein RMY63_15740 [Nostoc sp. ChiQUE01b]|nr:hypothetical protein [Nostoc sp. ChiQUE01b]